MIHEISFNIEVINMENVKILINLIEEHGYIDQLFKLIKINENITRENKNELKSSILRLVYQIIRLFVIVNKKNRK
jgi:methyl coenzyme M reductase alpha subunit